MDSTVASFNQLVVSYGEDPTVMTTESFFGMFETFMKAFQVGSAVLSLLESVVALGYGSLSDTYPTCPGV